MSEFVGVFILGFIWGTLCMGAVVAVALLW